MLGTRATARSRSYRYYTCFTRARYGTCDPERLDADGLEARVLGALADFYRSEHDLINQAIADAHQQYIHAHAGQQAELDAVNAELAKTNAALDRYLTAFEHGTLDEDDLAERLAPLRGKSKQLRHRRDELADALSATLEAVPAAHLESVADSVTQIINSGTDTMRKSLIETLIAEIKITGPNKVIPIFRVPQPPQMTSPEHNPGASTRKKRQVKASKEAVRTMTTLVELTGFEPVTP